MNRRGFLKAIGIAAAVPFVISWPESRPRLYGDGVHDDAEAIQYMLDNGGGVLPAGTFILNSPIILGGSGILIGSGVGETILKRGRWMPDGAPLVNIEDDRASVSRVIMDLSDPRPGMCIRARTAQYGATS
jgi:hypothetical protein